MYHLKGQYPGILQRNINSQYWCLISLDPFAFQSQRLKQCVPKELMIDIIDYIPNICNPLSKWCLPMCETFSNGKKATDSQSINQSISQSKN